ncbi:MAG: DUF192 domain-containing protein [Acidobacteriaceae bacterium]
MKKIVFATALFLLAAGCSRQPIAENPPQNNSSFISYFSGSFANISGVKLNLAVARTSEQQSQGLSNRDPITDDQGMLFLMASASRHTFWMKDMKFPIDIIWINGDTVADISKDCPAPKIPEEKLPTFQPQTAVDKVLEVPAGWSVRHKLKIGDKIELNILP